MNSDFTLTIETQGEMKYVSRQTVIDKLNAIDPFSFCILDNGEAYLQSILDHDVFYKSVVEMRNYSVPDWKHYRKVGMSLPEIISAYLSFYDKGELPSSLGWEDITAEMK